MIAQLLPGSAVSEVAYGDPPGARLHPAEAAAVARAVESRRREFTSVRHCARLALEQLGVPYRPLVPGPRGEPDWPAGVVGSMTHCEGFRAAVVARSRDLASVGIDAEPHRPLPAGLLDTIALPEEGRRIRALLGRHPRVAWDRLLFSAKEAVYKAWFPLTGVVRDFSEADLVLDPDGTFRAELLAPAPLVDGREVPVLHGRWIVRDGLLATAVTLRRTGDDTSAPAPGPDAQAGPHDARRSPAVT